jgi:hypothetical protein
MIRAAEQQIAGCERCRGDEAELPLVCILANVLDKHGAFEFILTQAAQCPNCNVELTEKTLVELQGGIEVATPTSS